MTHYICTGGCNGVSDHPGTCQAESCSLYQKPLVECNCTDGKHNKEESITKPIEKPTPE